MATTQRGARQQPLAGIFLRIFFSHLLVVMFCFIAGLSLYQWLFGDGVRFFLSHNPGILVPVMAALIGIAGLLAAWTTGGVAIPIELVIEALHDEHPREKLDALEGKMSGGTQESMQLIVAIRALMDRQDSGDGASLTARSATRPASPPPVVVETDTSFNVTHMSPAAASLLGGTPAQYVGAPFIALFCTPEARDVMQAYLVQSVSTGRQMDALLLPFPTENGLSIEIAWSPAPVRGMRGPTGRWILRGAFTLSDAEPAA